MRHETTRENLRVYKVSRGSHLPEISFRWERRFVRCGGQRPVGGANRRSIQVYRADCLAQDLKQDPAEVRAAMAELAGRPTFIAGGCPCGGTGLGSRW